MTQETASASRQAQREAPDHGSGPPDPPQASHGARSAKRAAADAWGMLMGEADRLVEEQLEREARLPKPYYEEDGITIYCGDCRDILPHLPKVDLVLTDPPYGISYDASHSKYKNGIDRGAADWDVGEFDPSPIVRLEVDSIVWGGNCFSSKLPPSVGWLAWVKTARDGAKIRQADMELAWTNCIKRSRVFHHLWIGAYRESESGFRNWHPTQKPEALMRWCIKLLGDKPQVILDPFMGSGTTLVAAKQLGRRAIGIEIEEKYCQIAVDRLRQSVFQFDEPAPEPEQLGLLDA